jgi:transcriptional pleiotropic regulator of transition state genes
MKSTGIVRRVDELGRIVIPMELRRTLGIAIKDPIEIGVDGETITLKKNKAACVFCGSEGEAVPFMGKDVCKECFAKLISTDTMGADKASGEDVTVAENTELSTPVAG